MSNLESNTNTAPDTPPSPVLMPDPQPADLLTQLNEERAQVEKFRLALNREQATTAKLQAALDKLEANPIVFALANIDHGTVLEEAGAQCGGLFDSVMEKSAKGKFAIVISVAPLGASLTYAAEFKATPPKKSPVPSVCFVQDGKLSRKDPRQGELPLGHSRADRSGDGDDYSDEQPVVFRY